MEDKVGFYGIYLCIPGRKNAAMLEENLILLNKEVSKDRSSTSVLINTFF